MTRFSAAFPMRAARKAWFLGRLAARVAALAGLWLLGAPAASRANDIARHLPPPGAEYVAEEVRIRCDDGNSLGGTVTLPSRGVLSEGLRLRYPAVVLLGDAGDRDRDGIALGAPGDSVARPLYDLADALTRRGVAVLRFDERGDGASTGPSGRVSPFDRASEARSAIEVLRRRADIDPSRIAAVGFGEGSTSVLLLAAMEPTLVGLVLLSPQAPRDSAVAAIADTNARDAFWAAFDPIAAARTVRLPALLLQSESEPSVSRAAAARLADALRAGSSDVTLRMLPTLTRDLMPASGADSGVARHLPDAVLDPVGGWLSLRLGAPSTYRAPVAVHARRRIRHTR